MLELLPLLLVEVEEAIKTLNALQWRFIHAVSSTDYINISLVQHCHSMVVPWLFKIADFCPFVLGNIIHFTFFGRLIRILASNRINKIFSLKLKLSMQMRQLMAAACAVHKRTLLNFVGLLVDDITFIRKYRSDIVFLLLPSDEKYLVLSLNWRKFLRENIGISNWDLCCCLSVQLMNKQRLLFFIVIMQPRFNRCKDIVRLKRNNIVQKASELINFRLYFNHWPGILLHKVYMISNFTFKFRVFGFEVWDEMLLLENFQKVFWIVKVLKALNAFVNFLLETF